jgi:hypothetical protein
MCRERFPVSLGVVPIQIGLGKMLVVTLTEIGGEILPSNAIQEGKHGTAFRRLMCQETSETPPEYFGP